MNKNALLGCWVDDGGGGDAPGMLSIIVSKNDKLLKPASTRLSCPPLHKSFPFCTAPGMPSSCQMECSLIHESPS